jgi:hypothetical protein
MAQLTVQIVQSTVLATHTANVNAFLVTINAKYIYKIESNNFLQGALTNFITYIYYYN